MTSTGWWEAFAYLWVIAILNLIYAAAVSLGIHPTAFLLEAFFVGAISLLVIAGPGTNALRIMLAPQTWAYGAATILGEIFYYMMLMYVPPADASVFMRLNILLTILLGWLLGRRISELRAVGMAVVLVGFLVTVWFYPAAQSAPFVAVTVACAAFMSSRNLLAEFHPWNRRARTVMEKMRVTGLVVLATSIVGLVAVAALSLLVDQGILPATRVLPPVDQFVAMPTIVLSVVTGCAMITAMQYLMFSAVVKITSENFFAVMALAPLSTLILQEAAARLGIVGVAPAAWGILPFMLLIVLGNIMIAWRGGGTLGDEVSRP
jgi:drug/metabolite transporter (DMT)-like permease